VNSQEVLDSPFKEVHLIQEWEPLFSRYKPENIPYIKKALSAWPIYESKLDLPEWKISVEDKSNALNIWVRTTPEGLNAVKA
jgi:START domain